MSIVFAYVIALVYPNPIVNVANVTSLTTGASAIEFYLRCDLANGGSTSQTILLNCGTPTYILVPHCNLLALQSYYYQTYAIGTMASCPSGYLQNINATVNLGTNLVILASVMMILGMFIVWIPFLILACVA